MSNEQSIRDELIEAIRFPVARTDSGVPRVWNMPMVDAEWIAGQVIDSPVIRRIQAEAWSEGHAQAVANVAWPKERKGNPYIERAETA